jgi:fibronectin type 3 domain-containing protein
MVILLCAACKSPRGDDKIRASAKPHSVTISWTPSTSPRIVGYNVYRDSMPGPVATKLNDRPLTDTKYQDTNVVSGHTYFYYVTAVDARGRESGPTTHVMARAP